MHTTRTRVRYGETDKMGVVYHANYLIYFELGRAELIRQLGIPYSELERRGIRLPIVEAGMRLRSPARYDDVLTVRTRVSAASAVRMRFDYTVHLDEDGRLLAEGHTVLASVDENGRPCRLPPSVIETLTRASREDAPESLAEERD